MSPNRRLLIVVAVTLVGGLAAAVRLQLSYDLGAFLPAPSTPDQEILTQRLGEGPGARLIFIVLEDSSAQHAAEVAARLRGLPGIARVLPADEPPSIAAIPPELWRKRLLLRDLPADQAAWTETLNQRLDDLMFNPGDDLLALIAADPALLAVTALTDFTASAATPVYDHGSTQYLIAEARAPAFDPAAQAQAVDDLRRALPAEHLERLLGGPVYTADLQASVKFEATLFSSLAGAALLGLMIYRFRSAYRVLGVAVPLAAGAAGGLLALTFAFDDIHGITLAFGFTLLGVVIDYPLHLFTHAAAGGAGTQSGVWPTLRMGIASTLIAYGAFLFSGTTGLQQLGLFAFCGIIVAALAAAWICATPDGQQAIISAGGTRTQRLRFAPICVTAVVALIGLSGSNVFNDELGSLTPVAPELLAADAHARAQLGVTDIRYLVSVRGADAQQCLENTEAVDARLAQLRARGIVGGIQSITQLLPSDAAQNARRQRLKSTVMQAGFDAALAQLPFQTDAFAEFAALWRAEAQANDNLTWRGLHADARLASAMDNLFYSNGEEWVSLIYLQGIADPDALGQALAGVPYASLVDLKLTSNDMVAAYRSRLLRVLAAALAAIAALLALRLDLGRALWVLLTVGAAVAAAAAGSAALQGGLSLFDLMALTLVAGLGLDYALFYSRAGSSEEEALTRSAVFICALSSLLVFSVLALSSIPVLRGIGTTVSLGVLAAYLLARFGRYANSGS